MSRDASTSFPWADRTAEEGGYRFRLGIGESRELQEKTDCGLLYLLQQRVLAGAWRIDDLRETIRLGLIGGGLAPADALVLVSRYVDDRPWIESVQPAARILTAAVFGAPDEDKTDDKREGDDDRPGKPSPAESSATRQSTETAS